MPFVVAIRQVFLQEFNHATHFEVVLRTTAAIQHRQVQLGRRGALVPQEIQFDIEGAFHSVEFRAVSESAVYATETSSIQCISELFRCPADISVQEADFLVSTSKTQASLHICACAPCELTQYDEFSVEFRGAERTFFYSAEVLAIRGNQVQLSVQNAIFSEDNTIALIFRHNQSSLELFCCNMNQNVIDAYVCKLPSSFIQTENSQQLSSPSILKLEATIEQQFFCFSQLPVALPKLPCAHPLEIFRILRGEQEEAFLSVCGNVVYSNAVCAKSAPSGTQTVYISGQSFEIAPERSGRVYCNGFCLEIGGPTAASQDIVDETINICSSNPSTPAQANDKPAMRTSSEPPKNTVIEAPMPIIFDLRTSEHMLRCLRVETQLTEQISLKRVPRPKINEQKESQIAVRTITRGAKVERILLRLGDIFKERQQQFRIEYNNVLITSLLRRVASRGIQVPDEVLRHIGLVQLTYAQQKQ